MLEVGDGVGGWLGGGSEVRKKDCGKVVFAAADGFVVAIKAVVGGLC